MAFYLKYRPRKVADIDLTEAREALTKILGSKSFPQAILLAGPKGIGKTSAARIIAKSLNCQDKKPGQIDPCNRCSSCLAIDKGAFLDVLEVDAASNRGIDDIRQLKEGVNLAPVKGKYKVYIIDEVHMLTNEAFNALLKTLEEPPERVVFLLCTTNPEKIPQTVLSRCVRINFHKASEKEVLRALKRVVKKENLLVENDQVLLTIAQNVDGSFRDGQKILEELSFGRKGKITVENAIKAVGRQAALEPSRLLRAISQNDLAAAIEEVGRLESSGVDWPFYLKTLLEKIRGFLHYSWGLPDGEESDFSSVDKQLIFWAETFSGIIGKIKTSDLPVLIVELAVRKIITDSGGGKMDLKNQEPLLRSKPKVTTSKKSKKEVVNQKGSGEGKKNIAKGKSLSIISRQQWSELLEKVKPRNHSLEAFLKAARPVSFENNRLILEVYYQFHKECLEKEANRRAVEAVAEEILNCKVDLFFRLGKKSSKPVKQEMNGEQGGDSYRLAKKIFGGEESK
jgi:DNA polymerase III subunit gamma/tau